MSPAPATKPAPRSQRADAVRNRERVLEAAREVMGAKGIEAQMDEIARAAGVGVGTVYRHFPTKDDLVVALADYRFETLAGYAREALDEDDPGAAFERLLYRAAELQASDRALTELMADRDGLMRAAAERAGLGEPTAEALERAQRAGAIRPEVEPDDVPMVMCGIGSATCGPDTPGRGPDAWRRFLGLVLDGMRAGGPSELPPRS